MIPKFRAYHKKSKKMLNVFAIDFSYESVEIEVPNAEEYIPTDMIQLDVAVEEDLSKVELMQSTGLKDKNGKEIFEGDILDFIVYNFYDGSDKRLKGKTIYKYASFILQTLNTKEEYDLFRVLLDDEEVEILGNIYENPDLIGE